MASDRSASASAATLRHDLRFRNDPFTAECGPVLCNLGSGLIAHSQKMAVAASTMAAMNVWAHRS